MRIGQKSRASKRLRGARDPAPQLLSEAALLPAPPAIPEPATPSLFAIGSLKDIDDSGFVHLLYRGFLLREPDEEGLNAALRELAAQPSPARREELARSFLACGEFRRAGHDRQTEARRLAALLTPEFQEEAGDIFADILPRTGRMREVWEAVVATLFADDPSFREICAILGRPAVNNGWMGKVEGTRLSGVLPAYSVDADGYLTIGFDDHRDDIALEEVICGSLDNGGGTELYLVTIDLAEHYDTSGTLHSVAIALPDGTPIDPSPMYVYAPETCALNRAMDAADTASYDLFGAGAFRRSSPLLF